MTLYRSFNHGPVAMHYSHAYNKPFHAEMDEPFTTPPSFGTAYSDGPSYTKMRKPNPPNHFDIGGGILNFGRNVDGNIVRIGQSATSYVYNFV
ncbi:unnamed protein product [Rotaria socialis]|uniref:Uncharacterized protein n=1 Tax=Rotaria socialis TaxID=392032 RepID=A0A821KK33_9BILA|nr:unnamed protein product [Rotaria socialis]CAF3320317.1 unnamed protein product [Rotaria socialis]CAF3334377.1 unnamed protein product [Rotaria socialis]CAF3698023.1 unnamed protein product [Rotaria socialis]CAF4569177.1 unnamed protein product [Rotaria socialis]